MSILETMVMQIIKKQELVIGPLAWSEAGKVHGLTVDFQTGEGIISSGDPKTIVDQLVARYERLFGHASHEVCRDAVAILIKDLAPSDIPSSLRTSV